MRRNLSLLLVAIVVLCAAAAASADRCSSALRRLEGWTIVSVTQVNGEFEGCDFDKVIRMMDGSAYRCSTYSYSYSFMPDAIVFGKRASIEGKSFVMVKVLIDGELHDMSPIPES
jgi:hypothetical protein